MLSRAVSGNVAGVQTETRAPTTPTLFHYLSLSKKLTFQSGAGLDRSILTRGFSLLLCFVMPLRAQSSAGSLDSECEIQRGQNLVAFLQWPSWISGHLAEETA